MRQVWGQHPVDLSAVDAPILALAAAFSLVAVVAYGSIWPLILTRIGVEAPPDSIRLFLQSQLGKYVPGSVWQYAGRIALARARGVPARMTIVSLGLEVAASSLAALLIGVFVLPVALALPIALALAAVGYATSLDAGRPFFDVLFRAVRRVVPIAASDFRRAARALLPTTVLYVPVWAVYGVAFWLTGRALVDVPAHDIVYFTAAFALGWLVGLAAVFAPGGIGVREAVLVGLLTPRVGQAEAIVIAATSRILLTGADLLGGAGSVMLPRVRPSRLGSAGQ